MHQLKELLDHLYFLVLYALPSMIDKSDRQFSDDIFNAYIGTVVERDVEAAIAEKIHNQIQFLKQEMLNNVGSIEVTLYVGKHGQSQPSQAVHGTITQSQDTKQGLVPQDLHWRQVPAECTRASVSGDASYWVLHL